MIDWTRVAELQDDLGVEDFEEITVLFMEEVDGCLDQLAKDSGGSFAEQLHFLKGSAANLGFRAMQQICEQLEASRDESEIPRLIEAYGTSKQVFVAGIAETLAS